MKRTHIFVLAAFVLLATASAYSQSHEQAAKTVEAKKMSKTEQAVRAVLEAQVAAWNRGDIAAFMDGYARSDETTFVSGDSVTHGWQTVLDRYKKNYDSREKMGTLAFTELEVNAIGDKLAIVIGRWQLTRAGDTPKGRFTLIFSRTKDGWRITHDHTSSA